MARRPTPARIDVAGRQLRCLVCDADVFTVRPVTLITSGVANSGLNKQVDAVTCGTCGYVHQFVSGSVTSRPLED